MKEHDYTIEALAKTFAKHAITAEAQFEKARVSPHADPEYVNSEEFSFNLASALTAICSEIVILKSRLNNDPN